VVARRSGPSHRPGACAGRPRRGFVTLERPLPRFVEVRRLANGAAAFYFRISTYHRKLGCEMANEPLGTSYEAACGEDGKGGRASARVKPKFGRTLAWKSSCSRCARKSMACRRCSRLMHAGTAA
jgi:hypothetical protein